MQHSHYYLQCRSFFLAMHGSGNTTAIILHGNRIVFVNGNLDIFAITCKRFVNGIVNYFIYQVMQTLYADITNIHCRTFTNGFQSF